MTYLAAASGRAWTVILCLSTLPWAGLLSGVAGGLTVALATVNNRANQGEVPSCPTNRARLAVIENRPARALEIPSKGVDPQYQQGKDGQFHRYFVKKSKAYFGDNRRCGIGDGDLD